MKLGKKQNNKIKSKTKQKVNTKNEKNKLVFVVKTMHN